MLRRQFYPNIPVVIKSEEVLHTIRDLYPRLNIGKHTAVICEEHVVGKVYRIRLPNKTSFYISLKNVEPVHTTIDYTEPQNDYEII